jgi:hypothetical protein
LDKWAIARRNSLRRFGVAYRQLGFGYRQPVPDSFQPSNPMDRNNPNDKT